MRLFMVLILFSADDLESVGLKKSHDTIIADIWGGGKIQLIKKLSTAVHNDLPTPVDYIFIDGDHSLQGITADWDYWRKRIRPGGIIALHDTLLTPDKPPEYTLGSIEYFCDHIRHDVDFEILKQKDSLTVLQRIKHDA